MPDPPESNPSPPVQPRIRFGLWYSLRNPDPWRQPFPRLYADMLEQIEWAEQMGYDDVWLTEHHFCDDGHAPSILPLAAAVAVRTKRIRIGTGVLLLPLHHPVRVAEDGATIDILSSGRFELGVGVGYRPIEFDGLGVARSERGSRTDEGLEIIRRLWSGETLTFRGRHFQLDAIAIDPPPVQSPPPIWVGGFAPASARRAARFGDGYIGTGSMRGAIARYRKALVALGRDPSSGRLAGGPMWLFTSKNPEALWRELAPHAIYQLISYNQWLIEAGQAPLPRVDDLETLRRSGLLQVGTPSEVVDLLGRFLEHNPVERFFSWTVPPGIETRRMDEPLELFARDVMPHFR
jgi:probable F420-dependent oxidoreductase